MHKNIYLFFNLFISFLIFFTTNFIYTCTDNCRISDQEALQIAENIYGSLTKKATIKNQDDSLILKPCGEADVYNLNQALNST